MIDSAVEKREMERKHAAIQQRVRPCSPGLPVEGPFSPLQVWTWEPATKTHSPSPGLPMLRLILILLGRAEVGVLIPQGLSPVRGHLEARTSPLSPQVLGLGLGGGSYWGLSAPGQTAVMALPWAEMTAGGSC